MQFQRCTKGYFTNKLEPHRMNTDDLCIAVAEKMGWAVEKMTGIWPDHYNITKPNGDEWRQVELHMVLPDFPTDENASKQLREKLRDEGWNCTIECYTDGTHHVSFWKDTVIKKDEEHSAHADTLPAAICLAFLKVKQSK